MLRRSLSSAFDSVGTHDMVKVRKLMGPTEDCILSGSGYGDAIVISNKGLQATDVHIRGDANTATHGFTLVENGTDVRIHVSEDGEETGATFVCPQIGDPTDPFLVHTPRAVVLAKPDLMYVLYGKTVYASRVVRGFRSTVRRQSIMMCQGSTLAMQTAWMY